MGRYRTLSVDVEVEVGEVIDQLNDDELINELKSRKCDMQFLDFEFPELDDNSFITKINKAIYTLNTDRVRMILEAIHESYHYTFIKEATKCDQ